MAAAVPAQVVDCFSDQRWRLNNLYWITDKSGTRVKFELNWAQAELLDNMHYLNLVLKARQLGFTTFIQLYMLDVCLFHRDTQAGVIAHTQADAEKIFRNKIKYPYDNLPDAIKAICPIKRDNTTTLELTNNSIIQVGTSLRGGTLQYLHVSEFGKVCAKFPEKAREIVTGALNTIDAGQVGWIESTAEGQEGSFYDMCEIAQAKERTGEPLTPLDWKFHFFPWWKEPSYQLDPKGVVIPPAMEKYFREVEVQTGTQITPGQRAWYVKKAETQKGDMKREYPSTAKEAFEASIEGAYYSQQMAQAEADGRITVVPYEPNLPVETWWDIGMDDNTDIWFVQRWRRELRFIDHYSRSGEGLSHYAKVLKEKPYAYSRHIGPHDIEVREWGGEGATRREVAKGLGINFEVAPTLSIADGIEACRNLLARAWFDKTKCADGIKGLKNYRKEWDEDKGVWLPRPRHDWASHPADALRTGAVSSDPYVDEIEEEERDRHRSRVDRNPITGY